MSNSNSFNGILILRGSRTKADWIWRHLITEVPESLYIGQARQSVGQLFNVTPDTPINDVLHRVITDFTYEPYSYAIWGSEPDHMLVPQRNSSVMAWSSDWSGTSGAQAIDLLLRLNQEPWSENSGNYAQKVSDRVLSRLGARPRSTALLYAGPHTSLILSSYLRKISLWLVYIDGIYALMWSTQENLEHAAMNTMQTVDKNKWLVVPINLPHNNAVLAIQPVHLVNKLHSFLKDYGDNANKYMYVIQFLVNRLYRTCVPLEIGD